MASRNDFDDFFGDDEDTTVVDTRADGRLYRVPLGRLAANLVNPREDFGTEDQLIDLGKSLARRQIQACPVVSRGAYLKLWPDQADQIGDVDYVLVSGERRFRAATLVGLHSLNCVADDNVAADRKTFMEAVVSENVDRQNFDPIEEAYAVQALVAEFGSNRAVAQHFERADGWVTQRLLLTHLSREAQALVRQKTIPIEAARSLGKLARDHEWDAAQQLSWWEEEQQRRSAASAARVAARKAVKAPTVTGPDEATPQKPTATAVPERFTAVKPPAVPESPEATRPAAQQAPPAAGTAQPEQAQDPVREPSTSTTEESLEGIPEPRDTTEGTAPERPALKRFPYDDAVSACHHLVHKMPQGELDKLTDLLIGHRDRQDANAN